MKNKVLSLLFLLFIGISVHASNLDITGQWICNFDQASSTISLSSGTDGKIYNNSLAYSNSLRIDIWFSASSYSGGTLSGFKNTITTLANIPSISSIDNRNWSATITSTPSSGTYYVIMTILEEINGTYYIVDYENFPVTATFSSANNTTYNQTVDASIKPLGGEVSIYGVSILNKVDNNNNSYYYSADIDFDADITNSTNTVLYAKLYYKISSASVYTYYKTTLPFAIYGTESDDNQSFFVADLPHNTYDFRIEIYDLRDNLILTYDDSDDSDLDNINFEATEVITNSVYVNDATWKNSQDNDDDGYDGLRSMVIDVNATGTEVFNIYAKVYYKLSSANTYTLYETTSQFSVSSTSSLDQQQIEITNLPYGIYDFKIEVYNSSDELLDSYNEIDDFSLSEELFESDEPVVDLTAFVYNGSRFKNGVDSDNDGFFSIQTLYLDVDNGYDESIEIFAKIYYKLSTSSSFILYKTTENFTITSNYSSDAQEILVSGLDSATYDFQIEIYSNTGTLINTYTDPGFDDVTFELTEKLVPYTAEVYSVIWSDVVDNDVDGYALSKNMVIDVDIISGVNAAFVYLKIYKKNSTDSDYSYLLTSENFVISGSSIGDKLYQPISELDYNTYDFKIEVYNTDDELIATYSDADDSDLTDQKFEKSEGAATLAVKVAVASWSDIVDDDEDGYALTKELNIDIDIVSGASSTDIYFKMYTKTSSATTYTLGYTSPTFTITGTSSSDSRMITFSNFSYGTYDVKIEIYSTSNELLSTYSDLDDEDLNDEKFEDAETTVSNYSIYSSYWLSTSIIDNDEDSYRLSSTLFVDVDLDDNTASGTIYLKLYYKLSTASTYTLYTTTNDFVINGGSSNDAQEISVNNLPYGTYDFMVEVYNTDDILVTSRDQNDSDELNDINFESSETSDSPIYISDITWSAVNDSDEDEYSTSRTLEVDVDNSTSNSENVYLKVYYKLSTSSTYAILRNTASYSVNGISTSDIKNVPINGLQYGSYDFMIEVYDNSNNVVYTYTKTENIDLADQKFEMSNGTSVDELSFNCNIYPNPATEFITIETNSSEGMVRISDVTGKIVHESSFNESKFNLSVEGLLGTYTVTISSNNSSATKNLIVK